MGDRSDDIPVTPSTWGSEEQHLHDLCVRISMFPCDNKTVVTVESSEDEDYSIKATNTCHKAERFVNGLSVLTM